MVRTHLRRSEGQNETRYRFRSTPNAATRTASCFCPVYAARIGRFISLWPSSGRNDTVRRTRSSRDARRRWLQRLAHRRSRLLRLGDGFCSRRRAVWLWLLLSIERERTGLSPSPASTQPRSHVFLRTLPLVFLRRWLHCHASSGIPPAVAKILRACRVAVWQPALAFAFRVHSTRKRWSGAFWAFGLNGTRLQ